VLYDRRLAVHLMVQPGVAGDFLSDPQFADQGLLARFLFAAPAGRAGTRFRNDASYSAAMGQAADDLDDYNAAITRLLRQPVRWKNDSDRTLGVELDSLQFSRDARALYVDFTNAIEAEIGPSGPLAMVKAFASKLPENAARIAGTLALAANASATTIEPGTLAAAIDLAKYYLAEAVRLIAAGGIDPELRTAEQLRQWLLEQPGNVIGCRTIYQNGPRSIRQASKARAAMKLLVEDGWARPLPEGAPIDGVLHREAWEIVRC